MPAGAYRVVADTAPAQHFDHVDIAGGDRVTLALKSRRRFATSRIPRILPLALALVAVAASRSQAFLDAGATPGPRRGQSAAAGSRVFSWGDLEVAILGWEPVADLPKGVSLRPGEGLVGIGYLALNHGQRPASFSASGLKLRDQSGAEHRVDLRGHEPARRGRTRRRVAARRAASRHGLYRVATAHGDLTLVQSRRGRTQSVALPARPGRSAPPQALLDAISTPAVAAGTDVEVEGWQVRVVSRRTVEAIGHIRPSASETALSIEVQLTNRTEATRRMAPTSGVRLKDRTGRVFAYRGDPDPQSGQRAVQAAMEGRPILGIEAGPGATVTSRSGFVVPADARGLVLVIDPVATERGKAILGLP